MRATEKQTNQQTTESFEANPERQRKKVKQGRERQASSLPGLPLLLTPPRLILILNLPSKPVAPPEDV